MTQGNPVMYHTGIVVNDLEEAMDSYSRAFGFRWAEPVPGGGCLETRSGPLPRMDWFTYSLDGPHRIELVEQIDNTAWAAAPGGPRLHHVGYFVDDVVTEIARLEILGFRSELRSVNADGQTYMSYHHDPNGGPYVEIVDQRVAGILEPWWSGKGLASHAQRLAALGLDEQSVQEAFKNRHSHAPLVTD